MAARSRNTQSKLFAMPYVRTPHIIAVLCALVVLATAGTAAAFPPGTVTGIDLATVLTLDERARGFTFQLREDQLKDNQPEDKPVAQASLQEVRTIVIDPGHGGDNSGALGVAHIKEKYLTLELAYQLRDQIHAKYPDVKVILTRYWDTSISLNQRVYLANLMGADLFMSLHYNAAVHQRAVGFETYFLLANEATPGEQEKKGEPIATAKSVVTGIEKPTSAKKDGTFNDALTELKRDLNRERQHKESGLLAETVQQNLARRLDTANRGVKQANFGVLRGALMPAVVVEAGFLTHPKEGKSVLEEAHRGRVVEALVSSVEEFDERLVERSKK
jgi:N-acetylmuramoyl-L-alanine amidase